MSQLRSTDNLGFTYQSLGQEINRIRGSLREQSRERPLLADWQGPDIVSRPSRSDGIKLVETGSPYKHMRNQ